MENIEKISKIKRETLSGEHYFQSLLDQAYMAQLLSESELEKEQFDCLALLAKKTERFNGGDSSSIRIEKAQDILASMMFTIGAFLKTYPNPDDAVVAVQSMGVEAVCAEGRKRIDRLLGRAKMRHTSLVSHLFQTENVFYSATIVDGIKGFFKLYYPDFAAQEIHITADYPVYNKKQRLLGIEFIGQYLEQLYLENQFLVHFAADDIHHLLCGYDAHYESLLFNLYEPVLAAALGCVIAGTDASRLELTPAIQFSLYRHFVGKANVEIEQLLATAFAELVQSYSFADSLQAYVKESLPLLAVAIECAAKMGSLDRIFIVPKYPEDAPKLIVSYGEKMDDALYRKVLAEFMSSESMSDKIDVMKEHVHSLSDLNDLLLDAELAADEIAILLKELNPAEIAALMKKYTAAFEMNFTELRDCEKILCEGLQCFVSSLPLEQQMLLENAIEILEVN
ncbi:MAG: hypothetical protein K0Q85_1387 [Caproiciproducens sp.]|jgi:hypothetical protein|nr:hypothetical protein [Caproiciproducens sp.]